MIEEDLWADLADSFNTPERSASAVPAEHPAGTSATEATRPLIPQSSHIAYHPSNLSVVGSSIPPLPEQNATAFATTSSSTADSLFLEDLWGDTPNSLPGSNSSTSTNQKSVVPSLQNAVAPRFNGALPMQDKGNDDGGSPLEETPDVELWKSLPGEDEDQVDLSEDSPPSRHEYATPPLQGAANSVVDSAITLSAPSDEDSSDLFAGLEQTIPPLDYQQDGMQDILFDGFGLLDIEAELAEQERIEAEAASQEAESKQAYKYSWRRVPAWMKTLSVIYIDWRDQRRAEQEALERLGYANIPLSKETRVFIIQAARAARLTHRREKELATELAQARSQLTHLYHLGQYKAKRQKLEAEIAWLEQQLASRRYLWQEGKLLATQLASARAALEQFLAQDPYEPERHMLKARIGEIERELVTCMQWVAVKKAPRFLGHGVELDDLIQYGMLGVISGIRHFDPTRGARLLTVINWWVFQALTRAVAEERHLIRLPAYVEDSLAQIRKRYTEIEIRLGRKPTRQELASAVFMSVERLEEILQADKKIVSLNRYIHAEDENEGFSFQPVEAVLEEDLMSDELEQAEIKQSVHEWLNCLTLHERRVIESRYGLFGATEHSLEEIGRKLKITRERVRQIQQKAEEKLSKQATAYSYPSKEAEKTTNLK